jgi:hypothetical protein
MSEIVAVKAETRMSELCQEILWTRSPVSRSYTRHEFEEEASAIFDGDVRHLGTSLAHESVLRPWMYSILLRVVLGGCGPGHMRNAEIARLQSNFRVGRVLQGFLDKRHFLPLVREPVVHFLIGPSRVSIESEKIDEKSNILSNDP